MEIFDNDKVEYREGRLQKIGLLSELYLFPQVDQEGLFLQGGHLPEIKIVMNLGRSLISLHHPQLLVWGKRTLSPTNT
ncbi:hypothetical protein PC119_g28423 [Phytophthora cactorum]|nr:hypothetical protein PC119_g28423 [Phytophthora cactorum]KAG3110770.1 hypothetical protein C6341_g27884 [Phytophthora cactorum]